MCVSEEYSTDLVQFQACEFSGMRGQESCVWEMGSGSHSRINLRDFSKPLQRGPVSCPIPYDPGGTELDAFLINQLNVYPTYERIYIPLLKIYRFLPLALRCTQMSAGRHALRDTNR